MGIEQLSLFQEEVREQAEPERRVDELGVDNKKDRVETPVFLISPKDWLPASFRLKAAAAPPKENLACAKPPARAEAKFSLGAPKLILSE